MRITSPLYALGAAAAMLLVAGCSGGGSAVNPGTGTQSVSRSLVGRHVPSVMSPAYANRIHPDAKVAKGWMSKDAVTNPFRIYVSQFSASTITVYKESGTNQAPIGVITNGLLNPQGMFTTPNGDLWVADTGNSNVLVFHPGSLTAFETLQDPGQFPVDVTVGKDGTVYVTNIFDTSFIKGSVSVYAGGATSPTSMLAVPNNQKVLFEAIGTDNTLYVNYIDASTFAGAMVKFRNGGGAAKPTGITFVFPGGMQYDNTHDLIANDQSAPAVDIFELPTTSPSFQFGQNNADPVAERLNRNERRIYVADAVNGVVNVYRYPSGVQVNTISSGLVGFDVAGVAVDLGAPL